MAKLRREKKVRLLGVIRRGRPALMMSTALQATVSLVLALPAHAQPAPNARPTGGVVIAGSAAISQSASNTTINQSTQRAAVNWQSFNVGSQQSVTFNQPSASAVTLNRVVGPDPSQIAGRIDANGQIVLTNQSGVTFYKGAQVNTNGLVVSAIGMTGQSVRNFVNGGNLVLDKPGNPNARVVNDGNITVRQAGLAALVAPQVANRGTITATLGHVVLAGAKTATLDLYGDGLLSLDVNNQVTQTPVGKNGKPVTALVTNTGTIIADGGTVQLTAAAVDGIVNTLVDAGGKIRANTVGDHVGKVVLAGVGGGITVEGQLDAMGAAPGTTGGNIVVNPSGNVDITSTARINASGQAGGGVVAIGTTLQRAKGGPSVTPKHTAANVTIEHGAQIAANALSNGNGGHVTVLSSGTTVMNGTISATGGTLGGDGGFIETSGKGFLDIGPTASVTALAPHGNAGSWLLDPDSNIDITNTPSIGFIQITTGPLFGPTSDDSYIDPSTIQTALDAGTSVTVTTSNPSGTQSGNISVDSGITLTTAQTVSLTLDAAAGGGAGSITLNSPITDAGSGGALSLNLNAGGSITFNGTVSLAGSLAATAGMNAAGNITLGTGGTLQVAGAASFTNQSQNGLITLSGAPFTPELRGGVSFVTTGTTGNVTLSNDGGVAGTVLGASNVHGSLNVTDTTGSITQTGALNITNGASFTTNSANQSITLDTQANSIGGGIGLFTTGSSGNVSLKNSGGTDLSALGVGGNFSLEDTTGSISQAATGLQVQGTASFKTDATNKTIALTDTSNQFTGAVSFGTTGNAANVQLVNKQSINLGASSVGGNLSATVNSTNTGSIVTSGTIVAGGTLALTSAGTGQGITFNDAVNGGTISLNSTGTISQTAGSITATTLTGSSVGGVTLTGTNAVGTLANFSDTGSSNTTGLSFTNGQALTVNGVSSTGPITLTTTGAGSNMTLAGNVTASGTTVALISAGTISQTGGSITAGTLTGSAAATVSLLQAHNAIANLGSFSVGGSGNLFLMDASAFNVTGVASVAANSGMIYLESSNSGGITIANGGTVSAPNGEASFQTNAFTIASSGSVTTGDYVGLGPDTASAAMSLGTTVAGELSLVSLAGLSTGNLLAGGVTTPADSFGTGAFQAGNINIGGTFSTSGLSVLSFFVSGAVTQTQPIIGGGHIGGQAASFTLLNSNNAFSSIGVSASGNIEVFDKSALTLNGISSSGGNIYAASSNASGITLNGAVSAAGTIGVQTDALTFTSGTLTAPTVELAPSTTGSLVTLGGSGGLSLANVSNIAASSLLRIGAISIPGTTGPTTTAGSIAVAGAFGSGSLALELDSTGSINGSGVLTASKLTGNAGATVNLTGANAVANLSTFTVTGGDFNLNNSGSLGVSGPVIANDISLNAGTLGITGLVNAGTVLALGASAGGVIEATTATISAGTLTSLGNVTGKVSLLGTSNAVSNLGKFAVTAGSFSLADTSALSIIGTVTASGQTYIESSNSGGITINATGSVGAGTLASFESNAFINAGTVSGTTFELSPNTTGDTLTLGTTAPTPALASLAGILSTNVRLGAVTLPGSASPTTTAGAINVAGAFGTSTVNLELDTTGAITQATGQALTANTLKGSGTSVSLLTSSNAIPTLDALTATSGNLFVADGSPLTVNGNISATGSVFLAASTIDINAGNTVSANTSGLASFQANSFTNNGSIKSATFELAPLTNNGTVTLTSNSLNGIAASNVRIGAVTIPSTGLTTTAGSIVIASNFGTGAITLDLESNGGITETGGALTAASLTGTAGGDVTLNNHNTIPALAGFNDGGSSFSLTDTGPLGVANTLSGASATISDNNALTINGTVTATAVSLTASSISIPGEVNGGLVGLFGTLGAVSETGTLIATTLAGGATGGATLLGATTTINQVQTIANFNASSFLLDDGAAVSVAGTLAGGTGVTIRDSNNLSVASTGSVTAGAISLTGANITIAGLSSDGGGAGTTKLVANSGTIGESGTLISGTLSGSATSSASLLGATTTTNQVAILNGFSASSGFTMNDGIALTVNNTLSGGTGVTILDTGALAINNTVTGTAVSLTADSITIPGLVNGGTVGLFGTKGAIDETGTLIAGTLTGSAATSATLTGASTNTNHVGTLAGFTASSDFTLNDGIALTETNTVSGGPTATILDSGALAINGTVTATSVGLTASSITIPGAVNGGTVSLVGAVGAISETGTLNAGTLSGSAVTSASLTGATATTNQVGTITNFAAGSGFTLDDGVALTVANSISGGSSATLLDKGALAINGTAIATSVSLTGDSISIPGTVSGTSVALFGTVGAISETGTLIAGTLTGSAATSATFTGATTTTNQVGIVNNFTAGTGFSLNDGIALTVNNTLAGGPSAVVLDNGALSINGTVTATSVGLTADSITIPGAVNGGTVALTGTVGAIGETGTLIASTLSASAITSISLTGATATANQISTVTTLNASSGITLDDGIGLTVADSVSGGPSATVLDKGALAINGTVTATAVSLTADSISIAGLVNGGSVALFGTTGAITEPEPFPGTLIAGTLTGSSAAGTNLSGPRNVVANLGNFIASGFTLSDDAVNLLISGTVNGGPSVAIGNSNGPLTVGGIITSTGTVSLDVQSGINIPGTVIVNGPGTISMNIDLGGDILIPGLVSAGPLGTVVLVNDFGGINETGTLIAGILDAGTAADANLVGAGSTTNRIGTLNFLTIAGSLTVDDGVGLTVSGSVVANNVITVVDKGALTINGSLTASTISLTADGIGISGNVTGTNVTLTGTTGAIAGSGALNASTLTGSAAAFVSLTGANQVSTLTGFTAPGGFTFNDGIALTVSGNVTGGPSASITDASSLAINGTVTGASIALSGSSVTIPGNVTGSTAALTATSGPIDETGTFSVGTLSGSASGSASFTGNTSIAALGNFTASGLTLIDNSSLGIIGAVNAGPSANIDVAGSLSIGGALFANTIALNATKGISIPGTVQDANSVSLFTSGGSIVETGALIAGFLSGSSSGDFTLTGNGSNQVAQLGSISSGGTFTLNDSIDLLISGPLSAPKIVINAPNDLVTFADGGVIATGGTARPAGVVAAFPSATTSSGGAFLTVGSFTQLGNSNIVGYNSIGSPNVLLIDATGAGNITLSSSGGLTGANTWMILDIGTGTASGNLFVQNLDVNRAGATGSTSLSGTVNGVGGLAAAAAAGIQPGPNPSFRFNSCPIQSVNCIIIPPLNPPTANPLNDFAIGSFYNSNDQDDLLLPIVSDQDY